MEEGQIQQLLNKYCANDMKELKRISNKYIIKIGGISKKDYDDFYSIALSCLADSALRYDEKKKCSFNTFLHGNIQRKFRTEIRDRNTQKRVPSKQIISLFEVVTDEGAELKDVIPSDFDLEEEVLGDHSEKLDKYLRNLSKKQRKIAMMLIDGYKPDQIREILHMSVREYSDHMMALKAHRNVSILM